MSVRILHKPIVAKIETRGHMSENRDWSPLGANRVVEATAVTDVTDGSVSGQAALVVVGTRVWLGDAEAAAAIKALGTSLIVRGRIDADGDKAGDEAYLNVTDSELAEYLYLLALSATLPEVEASAGKAGCE